MPSFCAAYFPGDMLFEVEGLHQDEVPVPSYVANTFSVLTRGAPTRPSPRLQRLLQTANDSKTIDWDTVPQDPLLLMGNSQRLWKDTIKGSENGGNPALEFFDEVLPSELPQWAFVRQLIVPEFTLFDELSKLNSTGSGKDGGKNAEQVDFFLPQADLVIEIDGGQHKERSQSNRDEERNSRLADFGIKTIRISTSEIHEKGIEFEKKIAELRNLLHASQRLAAYKAFFEAREHHKRSIRYDLTAIIRLQVAIMAAIQYGKLDTSQTIWKLHVSWDFQPESALNWVNVALDELFDWFSLSASIEHTEYVPPKVVFDEDGLCFDIRIFERPDESTGKDGIIGVRTSAVQELPFRYRDGKHRVIHRAQIFGESRLLTDASQPPTRNVPSRNDLRELCRRVFGHNDFLPGQETLIYNALIGQKSLGLMPTGSGKSLCFQLPSLLRQGTTIVVVPIKALGRDHCVELESAGFNGRVLNITSDANSELRDKFYSWRLLRGDLRFVFVSPERFQSERFREVVRGLQERSLLQMFVIDEVHCLSEWGHDFRTSYLTLPGALKELSPAVPVLGLTATASVNVLSDIQEEFEVPDEFVAYEMHRSRDELTFSIQHEFAGPSFVDTKIREIVTSNDGNLPPPTQVFSRYVNGEMGIYSYAKKITESKLGLRVGMFSGKEPSKYDAGICFEWLGNPDVRRPKDYSEYKELVQSLWKEGRLDVIVSTKAFGMGVNKRDVRNTLHAGMPSSMEAFYQEAGRAGRDRQKSFCFMLFRPESDDVEEVFEKLRADLRPSTINELMKKDCNSKKVPYEGDFRRQLFFLSLGLVSIEDETALVERLHEIVLASANDNVIVNVKEFSHLPFGEERLQETAYRLYQMGLIRPWIVTNWGVEDSKVREIEIQKTGISFLQACEAVASRIQAIDGKFANLSAINRLRANSSRRDDWPELYLLLLEWVRRKHLDSRLQSTKNLYDKCYHFAEEDADTFREELEAFFKVDNEAFQLAALRDMPQQNVVHVLEGLLKDGSGKLKRDVSVFRKLSIQLERLLEGTQDSPGLNLAAAMLSLLTDDTSGGEAHMRFMAAEPKGALHFWTMNGRKLLSLVAEHGEAPRELIAGWLLQGEPSRQQLLSIYESLPSRAFEVALFNEIANELNEVL